MPQERTKHLHHKGGKQKKQNKDPQKENYYKKERAGYLLPFPPESA